MLEDCALSYTCGTEGKERKVLVTPNFAHFFWIYYEKQISWTISQTLCSCSSHTQGQTTVHITAVALDLDKSAEMLSYCDPDQDSFQDTLLCLSM